MNTIAIMIGVYFLARWIYGLGGSRNIDTVLPWLRVGKWPAHKVLPVLIFIPFVAWMEGWILSASPWPNFGSVRVNFELAEPKASSINPQSVPEYPRKEAGMSKQDYAKLIREWRIQREVIVSSKRELSDVLNAEDFSSLGDLPRIILPIGADHIDLFEVEENQVATTKSIANGWFQRLTVGMSAATYSVITRCGFDLTVEPAERVCFSALPMPIFLTTNRIGCEERTATRNQVRNCDFFVNMPWVLMRMDATGLSSTSCIYDTLQGVPRPCELAPFHLGFVDEDAEGKVDWADYVRTGDTIDLHLRASDTATAPPMVITKWSRRQIMNRHESVVEAFQPTPEPFDTITHSVPIPRGHLAAMNFLEIKLPGSLVKPAWEAAQEIKKLLVQESISRQPAGIDYPTKCLLALGLKRAELNVILAKQGKTGTLSRSPLRSASSARIEPWNVRVDDAQCPRALPLFLANLL